MYSINTQQLQKNSLRKQILEKRKKLSQKIVKVKSAKIADNFFKIEKILGGQNYALYISINNEVETKDIIDKLIGLQKNIYLPIKINDKWALTMFKDWKKLVIGPFGIKQPIEGLLTDADVIDISVFPGVAFDLSGNRLGYGLGVFDKLFKGSKAIRIGLAFEEQIVDQLPNFSHDLKMNLIVTEKRILSF